MAQDDRKSLISKIGTFLNLFGFLSIGLFIISDMANKTSFTYLLAAVVLFALGWYLKQASAIPTPPDKRFEGIRRLQQRQREAKAKKDKEKKR